MNEGEQIQTVESQLRAYNASMRAPTGKQILERIRARAGVTEPKRIRITKKSLLIAALVAVLVVTTVFADDIEKTLKKLNLLGMTTTQVEELVSEYDGAILTTFVGFSRAAVRPNATDEDIKAIDEWKDIQITDLDRVKTALRFPLKLPDYLPEGFTFEHARMTQFPSGSLDNMGVSLVYKKYNFYTVWIDQTYIGSDGEVDIKTVDEISKLQINGRDATLCGSLAGHGYEIWWVDDGVLVSLSADDMDEAIKVAVSLM